MTSPHAELKRLAEEARDTPTDTVTLPRDLVERLCNAADEYGVSYLDSDDMQPEAENLLNATMAVRQALASAPQGGWAKTPGQIVCEAYYGDGEESTVRWNEALDDSDRQEWEDVAKRLAALQKARGGES